MTFRGFIQGSRWRRVAVIALASSACKDGSPPQLLDPGDQTAVVGQSLSIQLFASDPDGDSVSFEFRAPSVPDLGSTTSLTIAPDGHGVFSMTPLASQVGSHVFDFIVDDGRHRPVFPINITVQGAVGSGSLPIFREPLGQGTVLDLEKSECVEFEVAVEDADSTSIELQALPPIIQDSTLAATPDGFGGTWRWCPNREQREGQDRYGLSLSADDGDNPATLKDYLVVLRKRSGDNCPGDAPVIEHTPRAFETMLELPIEARITDDVGLKNPPIVLYSYENPGTPVDFSRLAVLQTELVSGDMRDGIWRATVPNSTAPGPVGSMAQLYYIVEASDNDDTEGDCDHRTDSPPAGVHVVDVTNNGQGSALACDPCSYDVQCGNVADLCLPGPTGTVCGRACTSDAQCDAGLVCSAGPVISVEGASGRQCVPNSGTCAGTGGVCEDDAAEDDDNPAQAAELGVTAPGAYAGTLCPGDSDWWLIEAPGGARLRAELAANVPPDMDLALTTGAGVLLDASTGLTSNESIVSACLPAGLYYLRVFTIGSTTAFGDYALSLAYESGGCGGGTGTGDCCVDNNTPGCQDAAIQSCVCAVDAFCCDVEWDDVCASAANSECGACGGGQQDCCSVSNVAGCTDLGVSSCVCALDPFCCGDDPEGVGVWDVLCVERVGSALCAPACVPANNRGPCCTANGTPGCEIAAVEACVCAIDSDCCNASVGWDPLCVMEIASFGCGACGY